MVVDPFTDLATDRLFHALADATRRDIVVRARGGEQSVSALARRYPISVAAVQKHVATLERAGLVTTTRRGRERLVCSRPQAIARARALLDELEQLWRERIDQLDLLLNEEETR